MNQTTLFIARTMISAASQMIERDTDSNFSTVAPYVVVIIFIAGTALLIYTKPDILNLASWNRNNDFNSIPLDVINSNNQQRVTHINTADRALPQPEWRWNDNPINREIMDRYNHNQSVDITDDDVLNLNSHFRNISDPLRDRSIPRDTIRPDSATLPQGEEVDLTEVLSNFV